MVMNSAAPSTSGTPDGVWGVLAAAVLAVLLGAAPLL